MDSSAVRLLTDSELDYASVFAVEVTDEDLEVAAGVVSAWYQTTTAYLYWCEC